MSTTELRHRKVQQTVNTISREMPTCQKTTSRSSKRLVYYAILALAAVSFPMLLLQYYSSTVYFKNSSSSSSNSDEAEKSCREKMQIRVDRMEKACQHLKANDETFGGVLQQTPPDLQNIWVNLKRKVSICVPHKVGSQTWRYFFHKLDEKDTGMDNNEQNIKFAQWPQDYGQNYVRAVQVRHPLERLLSAYRFIFERQQTRSEIKAMIRDIFDLYPADESERNLTENHPDLWSKTPSFAQFVQYVVEGSGPDFDHSKYRIVSHWLPYFQSCNPCSDLQTAPQQVILLEDIRHDGLCFLESIPGIRDEDYGFLHHVNQSPDGPSSQRRKRELYYGQLTRELMMKVYQRYLPDYLIYGYKPDTFFQFAKTL